MAAKVCLKLGIDDVLGWLDRVDRSVLDFWIAFDSIEPIGDEWQQIAEVKQLLTQLAAFIVAKYGINLEIPVSDELMPDRYRREKRPAPSRSKKPMPQEQIAEAARITRAMGFSIPMKPNS